jgi:hypothetical protein
MKPLTLSLLLCVTPLFLSTPSRAQPTSSPADTIRSDFRRAQAEILNGNYRSAQALLVDLFKRSPTFDVAASLAQTESRLGDHARAARYFASALASVPPKEKAETPARIRTALEAELAYVASLRVSVNRDGAEILLDGEAAGTFPQVTELYANPGHHTIEARAGSASAKREIDATAGASMPLSFELVPDTQGVPSQSAAPTKSKPAAAEPMPASRPAEDRANWLPAGVTAGLALVAVGVGTGFAIDASNAKSAGDRKRQDAERTFGSNSGCSQPLGAGSPICAELADLQDRRQRSNTAAKVSFVIGGVFAAAAVGSYFLWAKPSAENSRSARVGAWVDGKGGSVLFEGSF